MRAWAWGALLALSSCGNAPLPSFLGNTLTGSAGSRSDLAFDEVHVRRFPSGEMQVRYRRTSGGHDEIVAQVTVLPPPEGFTRGQDLDLPSNHGTVNRVVQGGQDFPALKSGSIRFDTGGVDDGEDTRGRFAATFEDDRTLNGTFDAKLEKVSI